VRFRVACDLTLCRLNRLRFTDNDIFEEVPIRIHNPLLIDALLTEWEGEESLHCTFDCLDLSTNPFLERNLECLLECVDDLAHEQAKHEFFKRKRQQMGQMQRRRREEGGALEDESKLVPEP